MDWIGSMSGRGSAGIYPLSHETGAADFIIARGRYRGRTRCFIAARTNTTCAAAAGPKRAAGLTQGPVAGRVPPQAHTAFNLGPRPLCC